MSASPPVGVLLVNLGTPDAPTVPAVRRFLREFLLDPQVVDANRLLWWTILHLVILPRRPKHTAEKYRSIWTAEGSPLLVESRRQTRCVADALGEGFAVRLGMRIGNPSIVDALEEFRERGCNRVVLFPLYPQYSRTTTGSVERHLARLLRRRPVPFEILVVPPCFDDPAYLRAVAEAIGTRGEEGPYDHLVLSFHGLPERYIAEGDPYREQCETSAEGIARELGIAPEKWTLAYQSRFGREPWLRPATDELVVSLAPRNPRILVAVPGFAVEGLETLHEIGIELATEFRAAGGEELRLVPALNSTPSWIEAIVARVHATLDTPTRS